MPETLDAIYENGVLRLLQPTLLQEHQLVRLTLHTASENDDLFDTEFMNEPVTEADMSITLQEVRAGFSSTPESSGS